MTSSRVYSNREMSLKAGVELNLLFIRLFKDQMLLRGQSMVYQNYGLFRMALIIPSQALNPSASGPLSHRHVFSKENTFRAFFSQVLNDDGGCQEVVRKRIKNHAVVSPKPLSALAFVYKLALC